MNGVWACAAFLLTSWLSNGTTSVRQICVRNILIRWISNTLSPRNCKTTERGKYSRRNTISRAPNSPSNNVLSFVAVITIIRRCIFAIDALMKPKKGKRRNRKFLFLADLWLRLGCIWFGWGHARKHKLAPPHVYVRTSDKQARERSFEKHLSL